MRIGGWLFADNQYRHFKDNGRFFMGLKALDHQAVLYLQVQALPMIRKIVAGYGLPAEQAEDVLNDATLIFLQKIESGVYQFEGNTPTTYCIEIAKRLALMATRRHKRRSEPLESLPETSDPDAEALLHRRELGEMVQLLLGQLGQPCDNVVKLYHIDGYSDEEVVRNQWTNYKTADSLKMKRSDCMKKLVQLAKVWKTSNSI